MLSDQLNDTSPLADLRSYNAELTKNTEKILNLFSNIEDKEPFEDKNRQILSYIYDLLNELDSDHIWCGLKPWKTKSGHTIWLCPEHYFEETR